MIGIRLSFLLLQFPWFEYIYLIIILLLDEGEKGKETVKKKKVINWTVTKEHSDFRCVVFFWGGARYNGLHEGDFAGSPVVETVCSQFREHRFHSWSGN